MTSNPPIKRGRKFAQVVEGARKVFLCDGFEGASVDTIARSAGVSKATLYSYFPDKRLLFLEVAANECRVQGEAAIRALDFNAAPRVFLTEAGRAIMSFLLSETGRSVFRIAIAESGRFPELGRAFWESGPGMIERSLTRYIDLAEARGELHATDKTLAAHQFAELCKAQIFPRLCLGLQQDCSCAEQSHVLDEAVETWLARYATV
ncbi:TetR/AcrR family transcriptional regulator [Palleronia caenipelagi]|uniref:TetR/AcrR family transcriptional regulator n=1 Tax=Palleronia caenipelagi TaxID=2489174 RepID=A0A547Q0C2_9RHOB|nr:TetR/AcrR family transcriptional regulator [Palleronia caenipelagi]TRD19825.1 TetR/AcrR family transcriptional regulator [Palleronia caenipelagi]